MWKTKMKKWMKTHTIAALVLCTILTVAGLSAVWKLNGRAGGQPIQEGIAKEIIRFHVLGNSDTQEDQNLKMAVKEEVIDYVKPLLEGAENIEETRRILSENLQGIQSRAEEVIREQGYAYTADTRLANCYFPMKSYGDCTFPAGDYEALRICIGKAEGKNWWCVLFPNLCFVDSLHAVVPEDQKQELQGVLTEEEYESLFVRSKILDTLFRK